jgi:GTP cyclohydrolase II
LEHDFWILEFTGFQQHIDIQFIFVSMSSKIRIYNSFEEAEIAEAQRQVAQTGQERIAETVALILRVYNVTRQQLQNSTKSKRIKIISYN